MKTLLDWLDGRKTYVAISFIWLTLFAYWQGWVKLPTEVAVPLTTAAIVAVPQLFQRLATSKLQKAQDETSN